MFVNRLGKIDKMKTLFSFVFALIFIVSFAQNKLDVGEFNKVETYDKLPVKLIQSDEYRIEVTGPKADQVEFINKNKLLKIRMKTEEFLRGDDARVTVFYKNLNEIHANEGSMITSDATVESTKLLLNSKEGAEIDLSINVNSLEIKTNSGGRIITNGTAENQTVVSNSGGNYDGQNLKTTQTTVTVNAGGEAKVNASGTVNAKTRAGGNIHIFGGAEVSQQTLAGGKIHIH